jgi:hypothetical protein
MFVAFVSRMARTVGASSSISANSLSTCSEYAAIGRPPIAPEKLLRASPLQAFFTVRSERLQMGGSTTT